MLTIFGFAGTFGTEPWFEHFLASLFGDGSIFFALRNVLVVSVKTQSIFLVARIPEIFRPKVPKVSWVGKTPKITPGNSPPSRRYSRVTEKNEEVPENFYPILGQITKNHHF